MDSRFADVAEVRHIGTPRRVRRGGVRFAEVAEVAINRDQRMLELGGEGDRRLLVLPGVAADTVCFAANAPDLETAVQRPTISKPSPSPWAKT